MLCNEYMYRPLNQSKSSPSNFGYIIAGIHAVQAIIVLILIQTVLPNKSSTNGVFYTYYSIKTFRNLASNSTNATTVLPSITYHQATEFHLPYAAMSFFIMSAIAQYLQHAWYATDPFQNITLKYLEYSISASLMMMMIALVSGIQDILTLVCCAVFVFLCCILGLVAHSVFDDDNLTAWILFGLASVSCLTPYALTFASYGLTIQQQGSPPWFVHTVVIQQFFMFMSFAGVQAYDFLSRPEPMDKESYYKALEWIVFYYDILSLVAKTTLCWIVLGPVLQGVM